MHFHVIKFEKIDTPVEDFDTELPYEDPTLLRYTDYYGEIISAEERKAVINSVWLKDLFDGVATIDTKAETITFLDEKTIKKSFKEYLKGLTSEMADKAEKEKLSGFEFRYAGVEYKGAPTLFCIDDYVQTSFSFIEDAFYHANETWKFGNIFDAHF